MMGKSSAEMVFTTPIKQEGEILAEGEEDGSIGGGDINVPRKIIHDQIVATKDRDVVIKGKKKGMLAKTY